MEDCEYDFQSYASVLQIVASCYTKYPVESNSTTEYFTADNSLTMLRRIKIRQLLQRSFILQSDRVIEHGSGSTSTRLLYKRRV